MTAMSTLLFLFFSRPRSERWPHHGRTFSIYPCPLSFWLTLPRRVLSKPWCRPSRPCVAFLARVHLAPFLALSLSTGNSLVSSWCDHSMLASLLWSCITVPSLLSFVKNPLICFLCCPQNPQNLSQYFVSKASWRVSSFCESPTFSLSQPYVATGHTSAFISRTFVEIGMRWLFHIFCSDVPIACPLFNLVRKSVVHSLSSVTRDPRYGEGL